MLRRAIARTLLPRLAAGAVPTAIAAPLHRVVRDDPALAAAYHALRRAEHAAAGSAAAPLSPGQRDLLEALVLGAAAPASVQVPARAPRRSLPALAGAMAVACATVFLVLPSLRQDDPGAFGVGDLEARSARISAQPVGVKVTCVRDARSLGSATAGVRQSGETLACPHGSLLAFSATNLGQAARHVFAVGVAADGALRWYEPFGRGGQSVRVAAGAVDEVMPALADTASLPPDPHVSLFVLISDAPFDAATVERQIEDATARGLSVGSLERLPLPQMPVQARIELLAPVAAGGP